jgi:hypothetical protein
MLMNRTIMTLAAAALLLSGFSIATARAEGPAVPKQSAYPELQDKPSTSNKPGMTADKKEKLMKELIKARDKAKGSAAPTKAKKP